MSTPLDKDELLARLEQLDGDLFALYPDKEPFDLVVVGGSAIVLRDLAPAKTQTLDMDVLKTAAELEGLLARYDINTNVDTFRFKFPSGYMDRLVAIPFDGAMLHVYTLSNEDLAITKLLAWRPQDQEDLQGMLEASNIDLNALDEIVSTIGELQINLDEKEWEAFVLHLKELKAWGA